MQRERGEKKNEKTKHQPLLHNVNLFPMLILQGVLLWVGEHQVLEEPGGNKLLINIFANLNLFN